MRSLLRSDIVWFLILAGIVCWFSFYPVYQSFQRVPDSRYYYGGNEDYPLDMTGNLATIREGYLGHWQRYSKFTSQIESPPVLLKIEYILIGQIGRLLHVEPLVMFYISRGIISIAYFITLYTLVRAIFGQLNSRIVVWIMILFATAITVPDIDSKYWDSVIYRFSIDTLPFIRFTQAAHHYLLGGLFSIISGWYLVRSIDTRWNKKYFVMSLIFGFLTSMTYAPNTVLLVVSLLFYAVFRIIKSIYAKESVDIKKLCIHGLIYIVVVLLFVVYVKLTISSVWDWNTSAVTESLNSFHLTGIEYLYTIGVSYFFALCSLPYVVRTKKTYLLFLWSMGLVHPICVFMGERMLGLNLVRFFLSPYWVTFGILSGLTITQWARWVGRKFGQIWYVVCMLLCVGLVLWTSQLSYDANIRRQTICFCGLPGFDTGFPKKNLMQAIFWLKDNTHEENIVLSGPFAGELIPGFSGNKVYTSWWFRLTQHPLYYQSLYKIQDFYAGRYTDTQAKIFLANANISYILESDQEKEYELRGALSTVYPFLGVVYRAMGVSIYSVRKIQ